MTSNYGYDAIYELTGVTQGATTTESYTYDAVGNRLSSLGVSPYSYNVSNQLTSAPSTTYTYDLNGNTSSKTDSSGTTNYTWEFENRLTSLTLPGTGGTVSFEYDPFGRRIYKSSSSGTSVFAYNGANLIEEISASGAVVASYSQGHGRCGATCGCSRVTTENAGDAGKRLLCGNFPAEFAIAPAGATDNQIRDRARDTGLRGFLKCRIDSDCSPPRSRPRCAPTI